MAAPPVGEVTSNKRGLCLLSLDGGGIRGLSELIIIQELMERIKWHKDLPETPVPADYFDLIGGTSTGGLIAILLGRLRLPAAKAIRYYETLAKTVFSDPKGKGHDGTFKASKLEEAIKHVLEETLGREHVNARMYEKDINASGCRAFVCAAGTSDPFHPAGPTLFRSYDVPKNKEYNCTIVEAARATSAAPTFFKRIKIGPEGSGIDYIDAGLGCNNPVKEVLAETIRVFGDEAPVACIVSIGTGQSDSVGLAQPDAFQKWLPTDLIKILKIIATDSGRVTEEMKQRFKNTPWLFNRLDVDRGLHSVSLAEWKELGKVRELTQNYMKMGIINTQVDNVVSALCGQSIDQTCKAGDLTGYIGAKAQTFLRINVPQKRLSHFVSRPKLLTEITERLFNDDSNNTVVLLGMGGIGKTQLALEVCRQIEESSRFGAALWVNASSPKSVMQSYKIIAEEILGSNDAGAEDTLVLRVQTKLRTWSKAWLMVFDNYDDPQAFPGHSIREYVPSGKSGRILFTSRHQDTERLGHKIDPSAMTEDESLKLLLQRLPCNKDEAIHGHEIVSTLGFLALALDQAGAYIRARSLDLKAFIKHYDERKEVVFREIPDEWEYKRAIGDEELETRLRIFTTWQLSFELISGPNHEVEDKEHLLTLAAFFDAGKISERYFETYFNKSKIDWIKIFSSNDKWDSYKLGDILSEFQKLSLLNMNTTDDGLSFSIHPVVCEWIKLRKSPSVQHVFATESALALMEYLQENDINALALETRQETGRHIDSCISNDKRLSRSSHQVLDPFPCYLIYFSLFHMRHGRLSEAEHLCRRMLAVCEKDFGTSDFTLLAMQNLAFIYTIRDRHDEAEILYKRVIFESEKRSDKETVWQTMLDLGRSYRDQDRYKEAEEYLERALDASKEMFGSAHINTLQTELDLATVYAGQNRCNKAKALYVRALSLYEEALGATHDETLNCVQKLAKFYTTQGQYAEAESLYNRALIGYKKQFDEKNFETLSTMSDLTTMYGEQGQYDKAIQLGERIFAVGREDLGKTHIQTMVITFYLAELYEKKGCLNKAKELFEWALAEYVKIFGATHFSTREIIDSLESSYREHGLHEEAEDLKKRYPPST